MDPLNSQRLFYRAPISTAPNVLLLDLSPGASGADLAPTRYYPIILENGPEIIEVEAFLRDLHNWRDGMDWLHRFNQRPALITSDTVTISRLLPLCNDWPVIVICNWPDSIPVEEGRDEIDRVRGRYVIKLAATEADANRTSSALLAHFSAQQSFMVRLLSVGLGAMPRRGPKSISPQRT